MTTAPQTGPEAKKEELTAEAAELTAEVQEVTADAAQARADGDTERADRLDAKISKVEGDLADIKASLKALADRPFHPAPEATPPATPAATEETGLDEGQAAEEDKPRKHRFGSSKWFGDRAYED